MSTWEIGGKRSDLILCTGDRGMVWPFYSKMETPSGGAMKLQTL